MSTGHAKNVANFEDMISFCTGYGATYNPSKVAIQLPSLNALRTNAENALADVNSANTAFINATNARQIAFSSVKPLATRLVNALDATDATDELIKDAKTLNRKVQGARKSKGTKPETLPTPPDTAAEDKQISVSQQSYDSIIENFEKLGQLVATEPTYTPNEVDLQTATLITFHGNLKTTNTSLPDPEHRNDTFATTIKCLPNDPIDLSVPFTDDFEEMTIFSANKDSIGISPNAHWDYFNDDDSGRVRSRAAADFIISGNRSISLDQIKPMKHGSNNKLVGTFNLSG